MSIPRYYTVGAVAQDLRSLKALDERLEDLGLPEGSLLVLSRRKDEGLVRVTLPGARTRRVESGLSRTQWFEFASTYLGVTAVSVLMGAVHLPTGIAVQTILTLAAIVGLIVYHRRPHLQNKLLAMGLPESFAEEWEANVPGGFRPGTRHGPRGPIRRGPGRLYGRSRSAVPASRRPAAGSLEHASACRPTLVSTCPSGLHLSARSG